MRKLAAPPVPKPSLTRLSSIVLAGYCWLSLALAGFQFPPLNRSHPDPQNSWPLNLVPCRTFPVPRGFSADRRADRLNVKLFAKVLGRKERCGRNGNPPLHEEVSSRELPSPSFDKYNFEPTAPTDLATATKLAKE